MVCSVHPASDGSAERYRIPAIGGDIRGLETPIGKWVTIGTGKGLNELTDPATASEEIFQKCPQTRRITTVPIRRDFIRCIPEDGCVQLLKARKPWLKRIPAGDKLIHVITVIDPAQRRVYKFPVAGMKTIAEIDEDGAVAALARTTGKDGLAPIGVAGELIESENAGELGRLRSWLNSFAGR